MSSVTIITPMDSEAKAKAMAISFWERELGLTNENKAQIQSDKSRMRCDKISFAPREKLLPKTEDDGKSRRASDVPATTKI